MRRKLAAPVGKQPPQRQTSRDGWVVAFSEELSLLRRLTTRLAWTIGLQAYDPDVDPLSAAREYHASHEAGKVAPARKRSK